MILLTLPVVCTDSCITLPVFALLLFKTAGDNVFVTTDHMGEPMPLNMVVQNLQVTLTEYNVKMSEQSKVQRVAPTPWFI